jgi:hypothetical protein
MLSNFRLFSIATFSITLITLSGCGGGSSPTNATPTTESNNAPSHSGSHQAKTNATEDKDVEYMTSLGLMRGHLMVAKELIDKGNLAQAEPHIGHPVEELYGDIEAELTVRQVPEFKTTLNQLHDSVKAKAAAAKIKPQYDAAISAIDAAAKGVPDSKRNTPQFVVSVIDGLLDTADGEYQAAIDNGKIVEAIEYQDSRGFILYAESLFQGVFSQLKQKNAEATKAIATNMTDLKKAWPSPLPPEKTVKSPEEVTKLVTSIQENIGAIK